MTTKYFPGLGLAIAIATTSATAADTPRYGSWQPPAGETVERADTGDLPMIIDELTTLVDEADKARAADPHFITDLRDLITKYDWPWKVELLHEDFTDGRISKDHNWLITAGDFQTQRDIGLHSRVDKPRSQAPANDSSSNDVTAALFGALLDQALGTSSKQPERLEGKVSKVHVAQKISNAFAIDAEIDARSREGRIEIGVYQYEPTGDGYILGFAPGMKGAVALSRVNSRGGTTIIDSIMDLNVQGDRIHMLQWTRNENGAMTVKLDGETVLSATDRGLRHRFDGFSVTNLLGEFSMREIKISGIEK